MSHRRLALPDGFRPPAKRLRKVLHDALVPERDRLALWVPVCVGCGDAQYFALRSEPPVWPALVVALIGLTIMLGARRLDWLRYAGAATLAVAAGFIAAHLATARMPAMPDLPKRATVVSGHIAAIDVFADGGRRITFAHPALDLDPPLDRRLHMRLRADDRQVLGVGDDIVLRGMLRAPAPPSLPGGRDLQREAFFGGLGGSGFALDPAEMQSQHAASGIAMRWQALRETIAGRIMLALPGAPGAIAATLVTGISSGISAPDRNAFAVSGLAHLLAVAGLHLGIVMGLAMGSVRMALAAWEFAALRLPTRQIAAVAALLAGAFYMALTGMHLPTLRSLTMAALGVLALMLGRRAVSLRGLAIAALLMLLIAPESLLEVSFQMSFAAVLALIAGYETLRPIMTRLYGAGSWQRRLGLHVAALFMTSLLAGAASLPYAAFHFGHVQFYFVLANLVAVPLTALWVLPVGLLSLALMPCHLEWLALVPMGWGVDVILWLARTVARLPAASIAVTAMPLAGLGLISAGLCWLCLRRGRWRLLGLLPLLAGIMSPVLCRPPDLLVSSDARLIALRVPAGVLLVPTRGGSRMMLEQGSGGSPLVLSDWRAAWAIETPPLPMPPSGTLGPVACDALACRLVRRGQTILLLRDPGHRKKLPLPADCSGIALLLSPAPIPLPRLHPGQSSAPGSCASVPSIDRFTVWRQGAQAIWFERGELRIVSVQDSRGLRPWIPMPGHRALPKLPMALAD
ncbi:ComEC/Rec2 family competence protein [Lichenicoccus sp.]|uniref:ComEC/Rec2 family competence protein n=1 Tax=Lichenicoccus sp. TaxID=2781899 RepID=UPI003D0F330B